MRMGKNQNQPDTGIQLVDRMSQRLLVFVIGFVTILALIFYSLVNAFLDTRQYAKLINLSGQQRSLSQRIVLLTFRYKDPLVDPVFKMAIATQLLEISDQMADNHSQLISANMSVAIKHLYFGPAGRIDEDTRYFIKTAQNIAGDNLTGQKEVQKALDTLYHMSRDAFIKDLDRIVKIYQAETQKRITFLSRVLVASGILAAAALIFCVFGIFRPIILRVKKDFINRLSILDGLDKARKESEDAVKRINAMSQAVDDGLIMIDGQGQVQFWNKGAEKLFGYRAEEAMGMDFHRTVVPVGVREMACSGIKQFAHTGKGPVFDTTIQTTALNRNQEAFPVEVNLASFMVNQEWFAVGTVRDITQRIEAETAIKASEERVKTILDAISIGILVIKEEDRIIEDANPLAQNMIGLPREKIVGNTCHEFVCPRKTNDCPIMDHGQTVDSADRILLNARGEEIPILKTVVRISLNGKPYLLESFVDLTQRKKVEAALQRNLEELELFSDLAVGREEKMIELKKEVNQLLTQLGEAEKYDIADMVMDDPSEKNKHKGERHV